jgi:predicted nucleic acid-binding protein
MKRKSIYIETTIPSIITARDSTNSIVAYRQIITREFWEKEKHKYDLYISRYVYEECAKGDLNAAEKRLNLIKNISYLPITEEVEHLAEEYFSFLDIPDRAKTDCYHLAVCVVGKIDYLMSWNMTHLGGVSYKKAAEYNYKHNLWLPGMNTPDVIVELEKEEL